MTKNQTVDTLLKLADGVALIASSGYAQNAGADAEIDLGAHAVAGNVAIDTQAVEIASDDELYTMTLVGCNTSGFASGTIVALGSIELGAGAAMTGIVDWDTPATGRYLIPFRNELDGTVYRYLRLYVTVAGTVATGIDFTAYVHKGLMQSAP